MRSRRREWLLRSNPVVWFSVLPYLTEAAVTNHVGSFSDVSASSLDQCLCFFLRDLVLSSAWQGNIDLVELSPRSRTLDKLVFAQSSSSDGLPLELDSSDLVYVFGREAFFVCCNERTGRVGQRENLSAQLDNLQGSILGNVSRSRDEDSLALESLLERCTFTSERPTEYSARPLIKLAVILT